jgi:hypothetical protein
VRGSGCLGTGATQQLPLATYFPALQPAGWALATAGITASFCENRSFSKGTLLKSVWPYKGHFFLFGVWGEALEAL